MLSLNDIKALSQSAFACLLVKRRNVVAGVLHHVYDFVERNAVDAVEQRHGEQLRQVDGLGLVVELRGAGLQQRESGGGRAAGLCKLER